jgi:hypothetical protein
MNADSNQKLSPEAVLESYSKDGPVPQDVCHSSAIGKGRVPQVRPSVPGPKMICFECFPYPTRDPSRVE